MRKIIRLLIIWILFVAPIQIPIFKAVGKLNGFMYIWAFVASYIAILSWVILVAVYLRSRSITKP